MPPEVGAHISLQIFRLHTNFYTPLGLFSDLSLVFKTEFDVIASVTYSLVVVITLYSLIL